MFVSDLRHFLDMPEDAPGPARAMAAHLFDLVRAATAGDPDSAWVSSLTCRRRPGNRPCRGYMVVARPDSRPGSIEWCCERCGDQGVVSGWEDSPFDLRSSDTGASDAELTKSLVVGDDVAASLRDLQLLDRECERLVYRMVGSADGAVLTIDAEHLDELLGFVAAEANHEEDRRQRKRLDGAFLVLQGALDSFPGDGPVLATGSAGAPEGQWRIVEMELWDRAALDLVEPAFIDFAADGTGELRFIAVRGWIDWRVDEGGRVDFTWDGVDEGDQVHGRGWAIADGNGSLTGRSTSIVGTTQAFVPYAGSRCSRTDTGTARPPWARIRAAAGTLGAAGRGCPSRMVMGYLARAAPVSRPNRDARSPLLWDATAGSSGRPTHVLRGTWFV